MATTVREKITVNKLTKFGFQVGTEFVNYSKMFKDQAQVVPGVTLDAELYVADSGKRYLNKLFASIPVVSAPEPVKASEKVPEVDLERAKKFVPKFQKKEESASTTMSKSEWQAKDRSQLIGGLCHDASQLTLAAVTVGLSTEQVLKQYMEILQGVIKLREEVK